MDAGLEQSTEREKKLHKPSVIVGKVIFLPNKMENITALTRLQRKYQECSTIPLSLSITVDQLRKGLRKTGLRKATGPDGISSRLLKYCAVIYLLHRVGFFAFSSCNTIHPSLLRVKLGGLWGTVLSPFVSSPCTYHCHIQKFIVSHSHCWTFFRRKQTGIQGGHEGPCQLM